jgi:hypothetical protein
MPFSMLNWLLNINVNKRQHTYMLLLPYDACNRFLVEHIGLIGAG